VIVLVGGSLFASAFLVNLEAKAARSAVAALAARQAAASGLALAVAELRELVATGETPTSGTLGPWGAVAPAAVTFQAADQPPGAFSLVVEARVAVAVSRQELVVGFSPENAPEVWLRR